MKKRIIDETNSSSVIMTRGKTVLTYAAASLPCVLLCSVTLLMLMMDMISPEMTEKQYVIYPVMIRAVSLISAACALICLRSDMMARKREAGWAGAAVFFFASFIMIMIISTALNGLSADALFGKAYRYVGVFDIVIMITAYMYCSSCIDHPGVKNAVIISYMLVSDLVAAVFMYDHFTMSFAAFQDKQEPAGIFFHGNHYGYFIVMAITAAAAYIVFSRSSGGITAGILTMTINMSALAINRSMGCLLAVAVTLAVMAIFAIPKGRQPAVRALMMTGSFILIGAAALALSDQLRNDAAVMLAEARNIMSGVNDIHAGNNRWGIWQFTAGLISEKPLFGYGCEGICDSLKENAFVANPHNEPLTYAAFFGIPAAAVYCAGVVCAVTAGLRKKDMCCAAAFAAMGYFISSLFGVALFYTTPFFFVWMGISLSNPRDAYRMKEAADPVTIE